MPYSEGNIRLLGRRRVGPLPALEAPDCRSRGTSAFDEKTTKSASHGRRRHFSRHAILPARRPRGTARAGAARTGTPLGARAVRAEIPEIGASATRDLLDSAGSSPEPLR